MRRMCMSKHCAPSHDAGDNVFICSRKDDKVKAALSELRGEFGKQRVAGMACNVCKQSDVAAMVERARSAFGTVDIWINNAGTNAYSFKPLIESAETDLVDIVDTNVLGTMLCCQAAIKMMREQPNGGHIFLMEGAGSDGTPTPRFAAYGATKRALSQLSKSLQARSAASHRCSGITARGTVRGLMCSSACAGKTALVVRLCGLYSV